MTKNRKRIVISLSVVASAIVTYFGFGLIGVSVASNAFINKRYSDLDLLEEDFYSVQNSRDDYPALATREEVPFKCGKETLMGYLYENESPKGVVIAAHGVANLADANGSQVQNYYVTHGYDVFAIDMTGCGRSTGKGMKTLYESKYCVKYAVETVKKHAKTKDLPVFLIGHSWGGYGVVTATDEVEDVSAVASFSGYNMPSDMMYAFAETNTSKAVIVTKPAMEFGVSCLWGYRSFITAESVIKKHPDIPYIIIHGDEDNTVPLKQISIYDNVVRDNYKNVFTYKIEGMTHGAPWKTLRAVQYTSQYENGLKELRKQYKGNLPEQIRKTYIENIDKEKASEVNADLLNLIDTIFTSCL